VAIKHSDEIRIIAWDRQGVHNEVVSKTILWSTYCPSPKKINCISLPSEIELHADKLKAIYLGWIYELGELQIAGKKVTDHLQIRPGLSYWWMTSVAQKFNASKTSSINDILKLLALEEILSTNRPDFVEIYSDNKIVVKIIMDLCLSINIKCRVISIYKDNKYSLYYSLPYLCRAILYFVWKIFKSKLRFRIKNPPESIKNSDLICIDILTHVDTSCSSDNKFISGYWDVLVNRLEEWGLKASWLHIYYQDKNFTNLKTASEYIQQINNNCNGTKNHYLIDNNFTFSTIIRVSKDYLKLQSIASQIEDIQFLKPAKSNLNLWPLQVQEWRDSLSGRDAIKNCIQLSLFEDFMNRVPKQKIGIYIMENQPWEMALIYSWKNAGHGTLIGMPHTVIRYWDLRYFQDLRIYSEKKYNGFLAPNIMAVNGPIAFAIIQKNRYPEDTIVEVEALRFLYLSGANKKFKKENNRQIQVLICGDFIESTTKEMLIWLGIATKKLNHKMEFIFKPHPAYHIGISDYKISSLNSSNRPLKDLLYECDLVLSGNTTSASLEAFLLGIPVIQMINSDSVNLSPLRGLKGVKYIRNSDELYDVLININILKENHYSIKYFNLDKIII
jgi:surface carbohydrate biosynthesis protein (TIGR04326 family)